jgi:hypothetical protein
MVQEDAPCGLALVAIGNGHVVTEAVLARIELGDRTVELPEDRTLAVGAFARLRRANLDFSRLRGLLLDDAPPLDQHALGHLRGFFSIGHIVLSVAQLALGFALVDIDLGQSSASLGLGFGDLLATLVDALELHLHDSQVAFCAQDLQLGIVGLDPCRIDGRLPFGNAGAKLALNGNRPL